MHHPRLPARRRLLLAAGGGAVLASPWLAGCAGFASEQPAEPYRALSPAQALRLANRLTWGANEAELARLAAFGPSAYVAAQLKPSGPDELPAPLPGLLQGLRISREPMLDFVRAALAESRRIATLPSPEERIAAQRAARAERVKLEQETDARFLWRALYDRHQLREQLTWFWANHFSVYRAKAGAAQVADFEEHAIRPHALGRFRTLLGAATRHPAMLVYLDNQANAVGRINENLARELMELHTLGVDGGYTQADVQALARVLTGHGVNYAADAPRLRPELQPQYRREGAYEFHPGRHDPSPKELLGRPVQGQGAAQLDAVLDQLARHPAAARFISRRLALFLTGAEPPAPLLARMAQRFELTDGDIAATLAVLMADPAFTADQPASFKDPLRYLLSALRGAYAPDQVIVNPAPLLAWLARMGQPLYGRTTPDGWPLEPNAWHGSGQLATRFEAAAALGSANRALFRPGSLAPAPMMAATPAASAPPPPMQPPVLPQWPATLQAHWSPATLSTIAAAPGAQARTVLALAAPEFMQR